MSELVQDYNGVLLKKKNEKIQTNKPVKPTTVQYLISIRDNAPHVHLYRGYTVSGIFSFYISFLKKVALLLIQYMESVVLSVSKVSIILITVHRLR